MNGGNMRNPCDSCFNDEGKYFLDGVWFCVDCYNKLCGGEY